MKRKLLLLSMFLFCLFFGTLPAHADEFDLAVNGAYVSGNIDVKGQVNRYKIVLPSSGTLTVTYQGWSIGDSYYQLLNEDLESDKQFFKTEVYTSSDVTPKTSTQTRVLEQGIYYLNIFGYSSHIGGYRVKAEFNAADNTETEPNDSFETAMSLAAGTRITGLMQYP